MKKKKVVETRRDREPAWVHSQEGSGGAGVRDPCEPVLAEVLSIPFAFPDFRICLKPATNRNGSEHVPDVYRVVMCI